MKTLVIIDQRITELMMEVQAHPKLAARMRAAEEQAKTAHERIFTLAQGDELPMISSFEEGIAFLAAEAGILLHGDYSYEAICLLCDMIREALVKKRTVLVS